ncbi:MAG: universal stress protein [Acidobacteriota bacterium]
MQLRRILMPTDFSTSADAALGEALFFARRSRAELHLLHVIEWLQPRPSSEMDLIEMDEVFERLGEVAAAETRRLLERVPTKQLEIRESLRRGISAAAEIVAYAEAESIDLIVIGTHGRRGVRRFLLGSVAEEVARTAACPVLTLPERGDLTEDLEIERIVVPFDYSDDACASLRTAISLARSFNGRIDLVHAILPPTVAGASVPMPAVVPTTLARTQELALQKVASEVTTPEVTVDAHLLVGPVPSSITSYAEEVQANLIVMASHGLSGYHRFLLGSVTERVVRSASCPVLVCRPHLESGKVADGNTGQGR